MHIALDNRGEIKITDMGLKIELNPMSMFKNTIDDVAQKMLDDFIKSKLLLLFSELVTAKKNFDTITDEYTRTEIEDGNVAVAEIEQYASFCRYVLPLAVDSEIIWEETYNAVTPEIKSAVDWADEKWKYSDIYGFKQFKNVEIKH